MDIRELFGSNLRRYRLAAGLSQEAVAERIGADRAHVSAMERGVQNVTLLTLWHTAQAVGVKPADLLGETDSTERASGIAAPSRKKRKGKPGASRARGRAG